MKNKLPNFLFKPTNNVKKSPWLWPSCSQPRTLSFRTRDDDIVFKTINSAFEPEEEEPDMSSSEEDEQIEAVVRGLPRPGERLFLELEETNSIMAAAVVGKYKVAPFEESVVLAMESKEPYLDFKKSMEEMVEAHGLKDWKAMEKLFDWYLNANGESNHHFIIAAFVDLLLLPHNHNHNHNNLANFASNSSYSYSNSSSCSCCFCNNSSSSFSSSNSDFSSSSSFGIINATPPSSCCIIMEDDIDCNSSSIAPCLSSLFEDDEEEEQEENLQQQHF